MFRIFFFLLFFISTQSSFATDPIFLRERLSQAQQGDFIVSFYNKTYSLLHLHTLHDSSFVIEEVSIPQHKIKKTQPVNWRQWLEQGAEGHTAWTLFEISKEDGNLLEFYSFSRKGWLEFDSSDSIFSTLLTLPFQPVEEKHRRKRGSLPQAGSKDLRSVWNPKMTVDGRVISDVPFDCFKALWPNDGSEIAGKEIEIYLPQKSSQFPSHYPYWLSIKNTVSSAKIRVIDSGKYLRSPIKDLPRRPPIFLDSGKLTDSGLTLSLKSPPYYEKLSLLAIPYKDPHRQAIPLEYKSVDQAKQILILEIEKAELDKKLVSGQAYHFFVSPHNYKQVWAETENPIVWDK